MNFKNIITLLKIVGALVAFYAIYNGMTNDNMSFKEALFNVDKKLISIEAMGVGMGILAFSTTTITTTTGIWFWRKTISETTNNVYLQITSFLFLSLGLASLTMTLFL